MWRRFRRARAFRWENEFPARSDGGCYTHAMHTKKRPVFLSLPRIHLPVAGVASILHRVSGVVLFLSLSAASGLFSLSLQDPAGWRAFQAVLYGWPGRVGLMLVLWALLHHLFAGIRHLLLDLHIGLDRPLYRYSAWGVLIAAPVVALWLGVLL